MKALGKLSLRVLSITLIVKSLITLVNYFALYLPQMQQLHTKTIILVFSVIPLISSIFIAILLWIFTDKIVIWIIGEESTDSIQFNISYDQLLHIVLKVVGIFIITSAIPSFVEKLAQFLQLNLNYYNFQGKFLQLSYVLIPIFQMLVGVILFCKKLKTK